MDNIEILTIVLFVLVVGAIVFKTFKTRIKTPNKNQVNLPTSSGQTDDNPNRI